MSTRNANDVVRELNASLGNLLEQVYQMQGMFTDEDGTIQAAIDDAENAEAVALKYLKE